MFERLKRGNSAVWCVTMEGTMGRNGSRKGRTVDIGRYLMCHTRQQAVDTSSKAPGDSIPSRFTPVNSALTPVFIID